MVYHSARGWVGADGFYSCDRTFKERPITVSDWDRYVLLNHWLMGAMTEIDPKRGNWDLSLRDDKQTYYATILEPHHYYYKDIET
jgi:hypothetical protein